MKKKLISRLKKIKKEKGWSYQRLAIELDYSSATSMHKYITLGAIPKSRYEYLNLRLERLGY